MKEKLIGFNDGCLAAMIARMNNENKWELLGVSRVIGMGNAEYDKKIIDDVFDDIIGMNSFHGKAYVGLKKDEKWGLLEVIDDGRLEGKWSLIENYTYDTLDQILEKRKVKKEEYHIV